jgi:hypothetical protein
MFSLVSSEDIVSGYLTVDTRPIVGLLDPGPGSSVNRIAILGSKCV